MGRGLSELEKQILLFAIDRKEETNRWAFKRDALRSIYGISKHARRLLSGEINCTKMTVLYSSLHRATGRLFKRGMVGLREGWTDFSGHKLRWETVYVTDKGREAIGYKSADVETFVTDTTSAVDELSEHPADKHGAESIGYESHYVVTSVTDSMPDIEDTPEWFRRVQAFFKQKAAERDAQKDSI